MKKKQNEMEREIPNWKMDELERMAKICQIQEVAARILRAVGHDIALVQRRK